MPKMMICDHAGECGSIFCEGKTPHEETTACRGSLSCGVVKAKVKCVEVTKGEGGK